MRPSRWSNPHADLGPGNALGKLAEACKPALWIEVDIVGNADCSVRNFDAERCLLLCEELLRLDFAIRFLDLRLELLELRQFCVRQVAIGPRRLRR